MIRLLLPVAFVACVSPTNDPDHAICFPDQKCDATDTGSVVATDDRTTDVLGGMNVLSHRATPSCVRPVTDAAYTASETSQSVELVSLENRNSLSLETSSALGV